MAILEFNGVAVTPDPSEMNVTVQNVSSSDSGRSNTSGKMYNYVVAKKRVIDVSWNNIDRSEANGILSALTAADNNNANVTVTYDGDPFVTGTQTLTMYYGDISTAFQQVWVGDRKCYSKFTLKLIEV